jgi:hypothetical protein
MNEAALELLRLDDDAVRRMVNFYLAYASTCEREWRESLERTDSDERALPAVRSEHHLFESASSLRKAAAWALLVDETSGASLLRRAADMYLRLDFGFGLFLVEAGGGPSRRHEAQYTTLLRAVEILQANAQNRGSDRGRSRDVAVPEPMRHPQQQAYAAVAAAVSENSSQLVARVAEQSSQRQGVLPVGALGTPVRRFWAVAVALLQGDLATALAHLGAMSERFSDYAESAMSNRSLWRNGHADFEAVDLDIVGLTVLACRRFGSGVIVSAAEQERTFGFGPGLSQLRINNPLRFGRRRLESGLSFQTLSHR